MRNLSRANSTNNGNCKGSYGEQQQEFGFSTRRKCGSGEVFGQKMESLLQLDEQYGVGGSLYVSEIELEMKEKTILKLFL